MPPSLSAQLEAELTALHERGRLRECLPLSGSSRAIATLDGRQLVCFCSNDYLGLGSHPDLAAASARAFERSGFGAGGSRLVAGTLPEHLELESQLAQFLGAPATLLFPTGYQANLAVLTALAGPQDLIVADRAVHASIIDGCRLSRAKLAFYPHLDHLRARHHLERLGPHARRRFLVTESLFSMDGDLAPLPELAALAEAQDAALVVDEAHAIGCLGPGGRGLCKQFNVLPAILVGTLGKAFGASGAFVAGSAVLRRHLVNCARSFLFTTAPPPPVAAAALAALAIISSPEGNHLRASLQGAVSQLRAACRLPQDPNASPILPVILGSDEVALAASHHLRNAGFLVQAIRPPTVREGFARLRITLSARHAPNQIAGLATALTSLPARRDQPSPTAPATPTSITLSPGLRGPSQRAKPRSLTILGTDTAVGKSAVATALLHSLLSRGHRPVPFKPVETGADPLPSDAMRLLAASANPSLPLSVVCPWFYSLPIAPAAASSAQGVTLSLEEILQAATIALSFGNFLLVETAGGLLTPYAPRLTSADLAAALGFPILLVARNALGTVNHTALALAELQRRGLPILGTILVSTHSSQTPDQASNASLIADLTGQPPLGVLPFVPSPTPQSLAAALARSVELAPLFRELT